MPISDDETLDADALDELAEWEDSHPVRTPEQQARRRRMWIWGVLGILAMTAIAVWWGLASTMNKPAWQTLGWNVVDARTTTIRYEVTKPDDQTVRCEFTAQETGHAVVGTGEVTLGPDRKGHVIDTITLRTSSLAVIGQITTCRAVG